MIGSSRNRTGRGQLPELVAPVAAYDAFAPRYQAYSERRKPYLHRVEEIVIAEAGTIKSVLDVGAGDGRRGLRIAKAVHARRVVLLEPSAGMRAQCPGEVEVWPYPASEIPDTAPRFDMVLCLWNVLGHLRGSQEKVRVLSRLRNMLAPAGFIFVDVNHRYNAASYGWTRTLLRMAHDYIVRSEAQGDVVVSWNVGDRMIRTLGHVFTHKEMKRLFNAAGLKIAVRWVIDYEKGERRRFSMSGQLLYQLTAA